MRRMVLFGLAIVLLLSMMVIMVNAAPTANNATGVLNANKYTLANLSYLSVDDFNAYINVKHIDPLNDQVRKLRSQGLDNTSIERKFAEFGITYNSSRSSFVLAGGRTPNGEELKHYINPTNPFNNIPSENNDISLAASYVSGNPIQCNVVLETYSDTYRGITQKSSVGTMATTSNVPQHIYTTHMGANGNWIEVGIVASQLNGPRTVQFFEYTPNGGWHFWGSSLGGLSPNDWNSYKLFYNQCPPNNCCYVAAAINNMIVYYEMYPAYYNLDCNVANEAWTYTNTWDAHDSIFATSQNMYLYSGSGLTWNDPYNWYGWYTDGYFHYYPNSNNPLGYQLGSYQNTFWMRTGFR